MNQNIHILTLTERPQQTTSALGTGLQMVDGSDYHLFEVNHFNNKNLKFKHEVEAIMATYREFYKDTQKKAKQLTITLFFTKLLSQACPCALPTCSKTHYCYQHKSVTHDNTEHTVTMKYKNVTQRNTVNMPLLGDISHHIQQC